MTTVSQIEELHKEIHRKVGRNLLLFQQAEGILKAFLATSKLSGRVSEISSIRLKQIETAKTQMMGIANKHFKDNVLLLNSMPSEPEKESNDPQKISEPWFSISFHIQGDSTFIVQQKAALDALVDDRNILVHHFLGMWDWQSYESMRAAEEYLDSQREKILPELETLKGMARNYQEARNSMAAFFQSDEGRKHFELSWLRYKPIVALLSELATEYGMRDKWVPVTTASQIIHRRLSKEIKQLKSLYGCTSLDELLLEVEMFEVKEELTNKGGFRKLFRLKPEFQASE